MGIAVKKGVQKVKRRDHCLGRDKEKDKNDTKALNQAIPLRPIWLIQRNMERQQQDLVAPG